MAKNVNVDALDVADKLDDLDSAVDVVQVYGIALEKGEYDSSDYANSLNWLWSRMKDMVADLRQTLKGGDAA